MKRKAYIIFHFTFLKARSHWPMSTRRMQKKTQRTTGRKFRGWRHPFSFTPKIDKIVENLQNLRKRMKADRRDGTPKGLSGTISKQTHSGKSGCWTDEPDAICMPNVNTGVKCYKYETHKLTSFYVRATNDVYTFHVPYLSSLSHFLGQDEAERIPHTILTNDNGHTSFVAFICCRLTS